MRTLPSQLSAVLLVLSPPALAFPDDDDWADVHDQLGDIFADPLDTVTDPDLVGSADSSDDAYGSLAQWYADEDGLYVRVRMDKDPSDDLYPLQEDAWAILIETDGDLSSYEHSIVANYYAYVASAPL